MKNEENLFAKKYPGTFDIFILFFLFILLLIAGSLAFDYHTPVKSFLVYFSLSVSTLSLVAAYYLAKLFYPNIFSLIFKCKYPNFCDNNYPFRRSLLTVFPMWLLMLSHRSKFFLFLAGLYIFATVHIVEHINQKTTLAPVTSFKSQIIEKGRKCNFIFHVCNDYMTVSSPPGIPSYIITEPDFFHGGYKLSDGNKSIHSADNILSYLREGDIVTLKIQEGRLKEKFMTEVIIEKFKFVLLL